MQKLAVASVAFATTMAWQIFAGHLQAAPVSPADGMLSEIRVAQSARTCKQVSSCEEAVALWCSGYRRADGDGDGIPCENVCRTKEEVDQIRERIGC